MNQRNDKKPLLFLCSHAALVIVWNVAGIMLLSQGKSALGPTASWAGAGLFAIFIALYWVCFSKGYRKTFLVFAAIGSLLGFSAIYGALTKDPSLWPSEFWRYAGIVVNSLGLIGFALALKNFFNSK